MLAKRLGDIPASARELNVSIPDLRRLTWSKPKLLEEAELERMGVIARAWGVLIEALYRTICGDRCGRATRSCRAGWRAIIRSRRPGAGVVA